MQLSTTNKRQNMNSTFWQVALVFLLTRNVLSSWVNNGKEVKYKPSEVVYQISLYLFVFYMQGFFSFFAWPQYVLATTYGILVCAVGYNEVSKEKFSFKKPSKVAFTSASFGTFQMATIAYYGGFFNGISI